MKKTLLFIILITLFSSSFIYSQQRTKERDYEPTKSLRERILLGVYFNSPYFTNFVNGSQFSAGIQPFVGYRLNDYIAAGVAFKADYTYFWIPNNSISISDFSAVSFIRGTIAERIILQLDGGIYSNQSLGGGNTKIRNNFPVVYAGVGYASGRTEIILAVELTGNLQRYRLPVDYKFGIVFPLQ